MLVAFAFVVHCLLDLRTMQPGWGISTMHAMPSPLQYKQDTVLGGQDLSPQLGHHNFGPCMKVLL